MITPITSSIEKKEEEERKVKHPETASGNK
jgi:hypothetical protein